MPPTTEQTDRLEAFTRRVAADAYADATAWWWLSRAVVFDAAAHRPGIDWPGQATIEQLAAQQARCRMWALECRQRAVAEHWPDEVPTAGWPGVSWLGVAA